MNIQARIERDFAEPSVMIKYGDTIIGKIPLIFLTSFDIYDCIKEFDNVINIPQNLVNVQDATTFVQNISKITGNAIYEYDYETLIPIIILMEYFQYDKRKSITLHKKIKKHISKDKQIIIYAQVFNKINKLWLNPDDISMCDLNSKNTDAFISILISNKFDIKIYLKMLEIMHILKHLSKNTTALINHILQNYPSLKKSISFDMLDVEYQNDWNNANLNSQAAIIFSFCLQNAQQEISFELQSADNYRIFIIINPRIQRLGFNLKKSDILSIKNILTNEVITPVQYFDYSYYRTKEVGIFIEYKYFTNEWFLVHTPKKI